MPGTERSAPAHAAPADLFARACARLGPRLMHDLGLTEVQAAGLLGNLGHESGGFRRP